MRISVLISAFLILLNYECGAQNGLNSDVAKIVDQTEKSLHELQTLSGRLRIVLGSPDSDVKMNLGEFEIDFKTKRNPKDSVLGWRFCSQIYNLSEDSVLCVNEFCDGTNYYYYDVKDAILDKNGVESAKNSFMISFLNDEMNGMISLFGRAAKGLEKDNWKIGTISKLNDTVINGRNAYLIRNFYDRPTENLKNQVYHVDEIAIDKETYLPVWFFSHHRLSGASKMDQKTYQLLSDFKVNEKMNDSIFECHLSGKQEEKIEKLAIGNKAPYWKLKSIEGDSLSSDDYKGRLLLIQFGYVGCAWCPKAMTEIKKVAEEMKEVEYIYIDPLDSEKVIKQYVAETKIPFKTFIANKELANQFGINAYPTTLLIDENGTVVFIHEGYREQMSEKLLNEIKKNKK